MNGEHKIGDGAAADPSPAAEAERLLRLPQVLATVGIGRTGWLDMVRTGAAPAPVRIGRAVAWPATEIQRFIRDRIRQSRGEAQASHGQRAAAGAKVTASGEQGSGQ